MTMDILAPLLLLLLQLTQLLAACPEQCSCSSTIVDCRATSLPHLPANIDHSVETLYLDDNLLIRIPPHGFDNLRSLSYLGLSKNRLLLHNYTFSLLLGLQSLDLSNNHLSVLREDLLGNLPNLTWLVLANNQLRTPPVLRAHDKLTYLDLSGNQLAVLQGAFDSLPQLDTLFLSNNRLQTLPVTLFDKLPHLDTLDLSHNELSSLPRRLFRHHWELSDLQLDHNRLKHLARSLFAHQGNLRYLTLSGNLVAALPLRIFANLTKLSLLDLSNNSLACLPNDLLSGLTELQTLKLSHNLIDEMTREAFILNAKLTFLHLDSNRLSGLPMFQGLSLLEELTCSFNRLVGLPRGFADNLLMLKCLQLTHNLIDQWDPTLFLNTTSVLLSNNPICSTKAGTATVQSTYIDCNKQQCSPVSR
ncbi:insulin-like growth factor-binding protein complex acid labile subunit [Leucoraja erinacea]|uniref:insulin-like growth factor-binding protein complex acid labile subunit n=1 Tax=Leucoraja erinaceus TaxID=7782 RepID=UPI002454A9B8|nr:insulin-like growth factor-binding protein complex acid labile subunit [Leucoraja erinacea]